MTIVFMTVNDRMYIAAWRTQKANDGGVPYTPDSKPFNCSLFVKRFVKPWRVKYIRAIPVAEKVKS